MKKLEFNSSIGVFDSGLGGLSVLKQFIRFLPAENYVYLGDTARVPYGNKSKETVNNYAAQCAEFLLKKDVKLIVVACNTVSSVALEKVTEIAGNVPVVGMIKPGAGAALRATLNNNIGIIGTRATISSNAYTDEIDRIKNDRSIQTHSMACPLFVPIVEEGMLRTQASRLIATEYLQELKDKNIDTLILGCTHYPLLSHLISEILPGVTLIDSGEHASVTSLRLLAEQRLLKDDTGKFIEKPKIDFYVTDLPQTFHQQAAAFLGFEVDSPELVYLG